MEQVEHVYIEDIHYVESCPKCKAELDLINNPPFATGETCDPED